jgi:hypothetical protein
MQIRGLIWKEMPMWLPQWRISGHGVGEEGVLVNVQLRNVLMPAYIFVLAHNVAGIRKGYIAEYF